MAAQVGDELPASRSGIVGKITVQDILNLSPGGSYVPNKVHMQTWADPVDVEDDAAYHIKTFDDVTIQADKAVLFDLMIYVRNDTQSWGGLYLNIYCLINGTRYNLGNTGFNAGVMLNGAAEVMLLNHKMYYDFPGNFELSGDYVVQFEIYGKTYGGTTSVNGNSLQNTELYGFTTGDSTFSAVTVEDWIKPQNFSRMVIHEIDTLTTTHL
tara:strand:- start:1120 stop:1752 length:633 start_codon:yes stop_codon:yes gene_type:complete